MKKIALYAFALLLAVSALQAVLPRKAGRLIRLIPKGLRVRFRQRFRRRQRLPQAGKSLLVN